MLSPSLRSTVYLQTKRQSVYQPANGRCGLQAMALVFSVVQLHISGIKGSGNNDPFKISGSGGSDE
jgi:hypothetical protein